MLLMLAIRLITLAPVTDLLLLSVDKLSDSERSIVIVPNVSVVSVPASVALVSGTIVPAVSKEPMLLRGLELLLPVLLGERDGDPGLFELPSFPYRMPRCGTIGTSDLFLIHLVPHALQSTGASGGPRLHCGDSFGFMQ